MMMLQRQEQPLVVIRQPDGSLAVGSDPARLPTKEQHAAPPAPRTLTPEEAAAAQQALEERRSEALQYQRTTLRRRRSVFLTLIACDFCFFSSVMIYQAAAADSLMHGFPTETEQADSLFAANVTNGSDGSSSSQGDSSSSSSTNSSSNSGSCRQLIQLAWWISPSSLRLEDLVLSIVVDIVAAAGAVQNRTAVLSLYCIVQMLSTTALSTVVAPSLSLFTAFRLVLLLLAFYLRSAMHTCFALQQAAELPLGPSTAARMQQMLAHLARSGLFNMLSSSRLGSSSRQEQQPSAGSSASSSIIQQQGLVQHTVYPASGAAASAAVQLPALAAARVHEVPSPGSVAPASISSDSLEGEGRAEVELAAGLSQHGAQPPPPPPPPPQQQHYQGLQHQQ